jgi:DNA-directed RNA polymerase sigma subunit (sigma70/sigma32)
VFASKGNDDTRFDDISAGKRCRLVFRAGGTLPDPRPSGGARAAERYRTCQDEEAARRLLGSHLRLVIKIARGFAGYGLPLGELIAEGNVGLMQALAKFEPERGFRFATYAMWWGAGGYA